MSETPWAGLDELLALWLGAHRYRCLGRELQPFTLFHRELLRLAGHALMGERKMNLAELELAVRVCSVPASHAGRLMRQRPRWWRRWWSALRALRWAGQMERESAAFEAYLKACCHVPDVMMEGQEEGEERPAPSLLVLLNQLSTEGHSMEKVGGEWPAGLADWMYLVSARRSADVRFVTDKDREFFEGLRMQKEIRERRAQSHEEMERKTGLPRQQRVLLEVLGRRPEDGDNGG